MKLIHRMIAAGSNVPTQYSVTESFKKENCVPYFQDMCATLKENRDKLSAALKEAGFTPYVPDGSYMMVVDFANLAVPEKSEHFTDDEPADWKVCKFLIGECKLATIPLSPFYSPEHNDASRCIVRLCFAKTSDIIDAAVEQIRNLPQKTR